MQAYRVVRRSLPASGARVVLMRYDGHRQADVRKPVRQVLVEPGRETVRDNREDDLGQLQAESGLVKNLLCLVCPVMAFGVQQVQRPCWVGHDEPDCASPASVRCRLASISPGAGTARSVTTRIRVVRRSPIVGSFYRISA